MELSPPRLRRAHENVVFLSSPGVENTHLAIGPGYLASQN